MRALVLSALGFVAATPAFAFPVTVDNCGTPITFEKAPERAVVHDLNMAEMAFALDLQPRIVGLTGITGWYKVGPEFVEAQRDIPELAPRNPSIEDIVAAEPDFLFAGWNYGLRPETGVTPEALEPYGIQTLILTESCAIQDPNRPKATMDLLFADTERLGAVFGKEQEAAALVEGWRTEIAAIGERVGENTKTRVFLYDSGEERPFTAGRFAMPTAMIEAAGGRNIMEDLTTSWGTTDWETVASRNPEFLVLLDYQDDAGSQALLDFLKNHPAMRETDAVRNERFVALRYAELTPGPANIEGIEKIAEAMHPDAF